MIQTEILARLITQLGLNDVNPGSVVDVLTQAVAQQDFAQYYQIAQVARLVDLDSLTGEDLDNKAFEYGLSRLEAEKAKGLITIRRSSSFVKVSTSFYAGSPTPVSGDLIIDVNDASNALISTSGTLILGRGTNNEEEVTYSAAPVNNTTYWRFTLDSPLANDHAVEETVILKQGNNESILAGTIVIVPATGNNSEIRFELDNDEVLLAGEDSLTNVEVTAIEEGETGNIPIGAISGDAAFPTPPFSGARAENQSKFTTGRDLETDDALRDRIKNYVQGITRAVKQAILNAIVGLVDPETAKRVVSASIVLPIEEVGDVKIYIDDGIGFEPSFENRGFETIKELTSGGEQRLQVDLFPVAKAQVETNTAEPYNMSSGALTLTYEIGNISETITFNPADFRFPEIATAEEIVSVINDRSTLLEARTSQIGKYVLITAKSDENEAIQVTGGTANSMLNFPTDVKETINIYVDDEKMSKDGQTATLDSGNQSPFDLQTVGAFPHTLNIVVDGKTANPQTATVNLADVSDPSAVTAEEIVDVLNRDLVGITAATISNGTKVRIESLTKLKSSSKLQITGGSLNDSSDGLNMSTSEVVGVNGDYTFNRELGILEFTEPMAANKKITANSQFTRGKIVCANSELYSPANGTTLVIRIDGGSDQTITFDGTFASGKTAQQTADFINLTLKGGIASVKTIGTLNYIQIQTNTYNLAGSVSIRSSSTANSSFAFELDATKVSSNPSKAYLVSGNVGPFNFAENDSLVVVLNDDIVNSTYSILMNFEDTVTTLGSTTVFSALGLASVFQTANFINDFYVAFKNGANTDSSTVDTVTLQGGGIARYTFNPAPVNMAIFAIGSLFKIENLANSENNGYFVVTGIGANYVDVENADAIAASAQSGTGTLSQRRQISAYNHLTGQVTVTSAFNTAPQVNDDFIVIPKTVQNVVDYVNNTKITSISLKAVIEVSDNRTKLQISSKLEGSDGHVQVTGGNANLELGFSTVVYQGLAAYSYWTGLLKLVHKTVYGDDEDLASFPGYGAAGITFRILAPTVKTIEIELDVTLSEGVTISSLENDIKSAVTGYVNTLGVGEDVIIERIRSSVIAISGIVDVVISTPTSNVVAADNEVIRVSDTDVLIG